MKFAPIRLNVIRPSKMRSFDIYTINKAVPVLLLSKDKPLENDNAVLQYNEKFVAYVPSDQLDAYKKDISDNLENVLNNEHISKSNKLYVIYFSLLEKFESLINSRDISIAKNIFEKIKYFVLFSMNDSASMNIFFSFMKNDTGNISNHMLNVGIYASMLTKMLYPGISNTKLEELSKGYFLFDIGMLKVDKNILSKKEKYTEEELEEIKKHPQYGVEILENQLEIKSHAIKSIVLEHHERSDGSGYPSGKTNINRFARICSMCDVFDAITSERTYRNSTPKTTFDALKYNKEYFIKWFGIDMYAAFVKCFSQK